MNRGKEGDNHASLTGRSKSERLAYTQPEYSPTLSPPCDDRHAAFSIVLVGIQIAEYFPSEATLTRSIACIQIVRFWMATQMRTACAAATVAVCGAQPKHGSAPHEMLAGATGSGPA
jgi:hypothetical protein